METKRDREFEDYLKQAIKEVGIDAPSITFTDGVMGKLKSANASPKGISYKPLISKLGWAIFTCSVLIMCIFIFLEGKAFQVDWFSGPKWSFFTNSSFLEKLIDQKISQTVIYGFAFLALFISIQVLLLKHHFDKRYKLH